MIFGLARTGRTALSAAAVGAHIGAAYWFTSSTSFANPAVTIGRMFSDTFAGIAPNSVLPFIAAMAEKGIDIGAQQPKRWTNAMVEAADVVVTMGCGDTCPVIPGRRYEEWVLPDPCGPVTGCGAADSIRDRTARPHDTE